MTELELAKRLGVSLAIGLLIGIERGWKGRGLEEGMRVAGFRTFGLIGVLGGLWAVLAAVMGNGLLGLALLGFSILVTASYVVSIRCDQADFGITTEVAALLTFALGALAGSGYMKVASSSAVIIVFLLGLKPKLHRWLSSLTLEELEAAGKLLLISIVLLPILPNRGYGPWHSLNPYIIWWMVVLVAGISFVGYFAIKIAGPRQGILLTSIFGGLASSTALTWSLARLSTESKRLQSLMAAGIVAASATMFPRALIVLAAVNQQLVKDLVVPMGAMSVAGYLGALWLWTSSHKVAKEDSFGLANPFELHTALRFGAFLAAVMLLANGLEEYCGDLGIYILSAVSGISDVDAIILSLARMSTEGLSPEVATRGILLATVVNTLVKGGIACLVGGARMFLQVTLTLVLVTVTGGVAYILIP